MLVKNCFFIGMITLLSVSLAMADPPAEHPVTGEELVIDCLRGTPDAIDGDLSDWELDAMIPAVLDTEEQLSSGFSTWDGPDDSSGEFYMLWDDENIYMAVVMKDDVITSNKSDGNIWNADGIEVFFATTNAVTGHDEHYQYGFDFKEQTWNWCNMDGAGQSAIDYLQVACTITGDGYICEAAIEYGEMFSLDWSVGSTIGFHPVFDDTDIVDGDRELQMTWTGREAHDQSLGYGYLILSDATPDGATQLQPGDADMDFDFDQLDLVQVQIASKYLTGQAATWGEGDWNGAPGGSQGNPPAGNGLFDQIDIIAALNAGLYLQGPYAAIGPEGELDDDQTSIVYDAGTGEVRVDAPAGTELTSVNIDSAAGIFANHANAQNLDGSFDTHSENNIFKATFGSSFGSLSFGMVATADLAKDFVANDLTVIGSLDGGGGLGDVDLVYIPEPSALLLLGLGLAGLLVMRRRRS
jgi:hypothetical protein